METGDLLATPHVDVLILNPQKTQGLSLSEDGQLGIARRVGPAPVIEYVFPNLQRW